MESNSFKYRAFISYSHGDHDWAVWLHKALETYRIPKGIIGRETDAGKISQRLGRIYRDEAEEGAAAELGPRIELALNSSDSQIVIASPRSAQSQWVNREITRFKQLGRECRIFVLAIDGEPYAQNPDMECFAEALKWKLGADESQSHEPSDPLAVDVRKFGRSDALLRLMAGILCVEYDDLKQRDLVRQRKERRRAKILFTGGLVLAIIAALGLWLSVVNAEDVSRRTSLLFAQQASDFNDMEDNDRALLWATGGLPHPSQLIKGGYGEARAQFVRAYRKNVGYGPAGYSNYSAHLSPDESRVVTVSKPISYYGDARVDIWEFDSGEHVDELGEAAAQARTASFGKDSNTLLLQEERRVSLWNSASRSVTEVLSVPGEFITSAGFDPTFSKILIGDTGGNTYLKDLADGRLMTLSQGENSRLREASFNPDGSRVLLKLDSGLRLIDTQTGESLPAFENRAVRWSSLPVFSPEGVYILTVLGSGVVYLVDSATGRKQTQLGYENDLYWMGAFSPDGKQILLVTREGLARLFDAVSGDLIRSLEGMGGEWQKPVFSVDGQLVAALHQKGSWGLWNADTGVLINELTDTDPQARIAGFNHDATQVLIISGSRVLRWDTRAGVLLESLDVKGQIETAEFTGEGSSILLLSRFKPREDPDQWMFKRWDTSTAALSWSLQGHSDRVTHAGFSHDGKWVVTSSEDGSAIVWEAATNKRLKSLDAQFKKPGFLDFRWANSTFSPDDRRLLTSPGPGDAAILWDTRSWQAIRVFEHDRGMIIAAQFSPDSRRISTVSENGTARIWDAESGEPLHLFSDPDTDYYYAGFSPDNQEIRTVTANGETRLWNAETFTAIRTLFQLEDEYYVRAVSDDGNLLAIQLDEEAQIRDARDGKLVTTIDLNGIRVFRMVFSPDGSRLMVADDDGKLVMWDAGSGRVIHKIQAHDKTVLSAVFSPDQTRILTASSTDVRLWNLATGTLLKAYGHGLNQSFFIAVFNPDGSQVLGGTEQGIILVWDALSEASSWDLPEMFRMGCDRMERNRTGQFVTNSPILSESAWDGTDLKSPCSRRGMLSLDWWRIRLNFFVDSALATVRD